MRVRESCSAIAVLLFCVLLALQSPSTKAQRFECRQVTLYLHLQQLLPETSCCINSTVCALILGKLYVWYDNLGCMAINISKVAN